MSGENIPISASTSATSLHVPRKRSRSRYDKTKLPTPPPDPRASERADKENDFFEYLKSLQKGTPTAMGRSASIFAPAIAAEDAFDHLEKLYKLMEQMLMLREQNAKLHRRVRDLEHYSNLEKMQKHLNDNVANDDIQDLDKDTAFAETILESILLGTKRPPPARPNLRQSVLRRQRNRSCSSGIDGNLRRTSLMPGGIDKPAKVSKWTKVKAAFKWEKASVTVGDAKSQDSGIGGMMPVNLEVARYLRVPSTSDDLAHSPADSGAAEISTPGSLSTTSSNEDFRRNVLRSRSEDFHSSDEDHLHHYNIEYIPQSKEEQANSQKASSSKTLRTPWAMMKDIIQTRNSFKKKHRLSAKSDDIAMEESIGTDNEDVFEDDSKCRITQQSPSPKEEAKVSKQIANAVPPEIVARYQQVIAEDNSAVKDGRKVSKWTRVKRAFLTNPDSKEMPCIKLDETNKVQAEIRRNYRQLQKKLSLEFQDKYQEWEKSTSTLTSNPIPSCSSCVPTEDRKDVAFMKKMEEWQKIKSQPTIKQRPNIQLQSEENLPPEFRKKLQEWQKIKKSSTKEESAKRKLGDWPKWKSISGQRSDEPQIDYPQLSEDFIKKMETWKQIKAGMLLNEDSESRKSAKENKSPSPRMNRKDSSNKQSKKVKDQHDRELQWFEKELSKIEKEKQRLERERQKFLEREERLTKLRRSVMGGSKKDVLVHTPSGFYRFEGISRKFTQKLYEWEKAQGIGPEASTFALLSSCYASEIRPDAKNNNSTFNTAPLIRSKSADSIVNSAFNMTCPLMSHQPSSLSLNDVENLEKECLVDSKTSSGEYMEQDSVDADEPEALIVEVEDIVEETAAPLQNYLIKQQTPIYQREGLKNMCEGETCKAPKIRRSESTRAQTNYNLIEDVLRILKSLTEKELEIQKISQQLDNYEAISLTDYTTKFEDMQNSEKITLIKECEDSQKKSTQSLLEKLTRLQEANSTVAINITSEQKSYTGHQLTDTLETVQDISSDLLQTAEKLDINTHKRNTSKKQLRHSNINIIEEVNQMRTKILELRRLLSYVCAASDLTTPNRKKAVEKKLHKMSKSENACEDRKGHNNIYVKSESSQGATKKRLRYRQKGSQCKTLEDSEDEDNKTIKSSDRKLNKHKKMTRARSIPESFASYSKTKENNQEPADDVIIDPDVVQKVVVPTETNIVQLTESERSPDSPVTIFVKTTRKLFTPIVESSMSIESPTILPTKENVIFEEKSVDEIVLREEEIVEREISTKPQTEVNKNEIVLSPVVHLPPITASPTTQRKIAKEISPSIRIMLVKYNQKLQEHEISGARSGGSSGSASPVAWRSPTSERRVKVQTERYQKELNKLSPLLGGRREVQKSASVGVLHLNRKQVTVPHKQLNKESSQDDDVMEKCKISKSSSAGFITGQQQKQQKNDERKPSSLKITPSKPSNASSSNRSPEVRSKQLQKAKEEFLKAGCVSVPAESSDSSCVNYQRNRLSQISMGSESSYDSSAYEGLLIKSASAGMINIEADAYKQIDPEIRKKGYESLPRTSKSKEGLLGGKFALANIASTFRKVKMRRGKNHHKMNAVSTLCRQSLVVDITKHDRSKKEDQEAGSAAESRNVSSDDVSSAPSSRTGSWIKRSMIFKSKQ